MLKQSLIFSFIFFLLFLVIGSKSAHAEFRLEPATKFAYKDGFTQIPGGARVYGALVSISEFTDTPADEFEVQGGIAFSSRGKTRFSLGSFKGSIVNSKTKVKYKFRWRPDQTGPIVDRCEEQAYEFVQISGDKIDFPIALSCDLKQKTQVVTVSTPSEVELYESSIFEVAGKGERWKIFELPAVSSKGGRVASFKVQQKDNKYEFEIIAKKVQLGEQQEKSKKIDGVTGYISAGSFQATLSKSGSSVNDSKVSFMTGVTSPKLFWNLKIGMDYNSVLSGSVSAATNVQYSDLAIHLGYYSENRNSDLFARGVFRNSTISEDSQVLKFKSSRAGFELGFDWRPGQSHQLHILAGTYALGSSLLKSHVGLNLAYYYKFRPKVSDLAFGFGLDKKDLVITNNSEDSKLSLTQVQILLKY